MLAKDKKVKISIITVAFNAEQTIEDCIKSVLKQTYKNIEYIIIDGKSTDLTLDKIKNTLNQFPKIDIQIVSEKDDGIYFAMNKGIALATGEVVGILNADDIYANDSVLEKVMSRFNSNSTDAVYGDLVYTKNNNLQKVVRYWKSGIYKKKSFLYGWMPPHPTFFVRKSIYNQFGAFNTKLKSAADYELMLKFIHKNKIKLDYIPEILVKMRAGGQSNSSINNRVNANNEDKKAWELNNLEPYFFTMILKPFRKIFQFINRPTQINS